MKRSLEKSSGFGGGLSKNRSTWLNISMENVSRRVSSEDVKNKRHLRSFFAVEALTRHRDTICLDHVLSIVLGNGGCRPSRHIIICRPV